jgi:hypothetical protein
VRRWPVTLHAPVADSAEQQAAEGVVVLGAVRFVAAPEAMARGEQFPGLAERLVIDDWRMHDLKE